MKWSVTTKEPFCFHKCPSFYIVHLPMSPLQSQLPSQIKHPFWFSENSFVLQSSTWCCIIYEMFYDFSNTKWTLFSINSYNNNRKGNYFPLKENINRYTLCFHIQSNGEFTSLSSIPAEKAMAPYSSTPAWEIPWMEESGRLQSMGSLRVRHDWATSLSCFTFMHWRRKWQPTPVFLPGEPRDGGAWWAAVYGVAQSQTRLKWLSSSSSKAFQRFWERMTHIFSRYPLCLAVSASSEFIKFVGHHVDGISIQVHVKTNLICSYLRLRPVTKITITHLPIYMSLLFAWKTEGKKKTLKQILIYHWNTKITLAK